MPRKPNPNRPYWSAAIADARVRAGMTQGDLCKKINIQLTRLKKYETGERMPSFDILYEIALATGEPVYNLMDFDKRHDRRSGYDEFVESPYQKIIAYMNDDNIEFHNLSDTGNPDNVVKIIHNKTCQSTICQKTDLVLEVAKIKKDLKQKYEAELKKRVTAHIKKLIK